MTQPNPDGSHDELRPSKGLSNPIFVFEASTTDAERVAHDIKARLERLERDRDAAPEAADPGPIVRSCAYLTLIAFTLAIAAGLAALTGWFLSTL